MTTASVFSPPDNIWNFQFPPPSAEQDSELLKALHFVPGLKELLMLRQVHALEHATVWVLSDAAKGTASFLPPRAGEELGGLSTERGFYLYGKVDSDRLYRAVRLALDRLISGEWDLAIHPRCGTNLSVGIVLTAGLVLGTHLLLPRSPIEQVLGLGMAATAATQLTPDLGSLAQRYLTTSIPFNLTIGDITVMPDVWGRSAQFVRVKWVEPQ